MVEQREASWTAHRISVAVCAAMATAVALTVSNESVTPIVIYAEPPWVNHGARAMVVVAQIVVLVCVFLNRTWVFGLLLAAGLSGIIGAGLSLNGVAAAILRGFGGKEEADRLLLLLLVQFVMFTMAVRGWCRAPADGKAQHGVPIAWGIVSLWVAVYWWLWNTSDPMAGWWKAYGALVALWASLWAGSRWLRPKGTGTGLGLER